MHRLSCEVSRNRVAAGQGHDLDLLVRFNAPAPPKDAQRRPLCLVPVVDVSGSMGGGKLESVKRALVRLSEHLVPGDFLGLVTFDTEVHVPLELGELTNARRADFVREVGRLRPGSSTNLSGGLLEAAATIARRGRPELRTRVLALTDGQVNHGPAQTPEELRALVRERCTAFTLSAYGYGGDCHHALLGDLADAGGGAYASIENDDAVMTAFARELGGLLSTYASDVRVKIIPSAGAPIEERLGDLLHLGELSTVARVAFPTRSFGSVTIAHVEVRWRDASGKEQVQELTPSVEFVPASEADAADRADVSRARDERVLRAAQKQAEDLAQRGDFAGARMALGAAIERLRDAALVAYARDQLLPLYRDREGYSMSSSKRSSSYAALARKRQLIADGDVEAAFGVAASMPELEMEELFKAVKKKGGKKSR